MLSPRRSPLPRRALHALAACGLVAASVPFAFVAPAEACVAARREPGPITPATPPKPQGVIDQAGERILFIQDGATTTAHVQVQYVGDAKDFSWLVPVPAEPTLGVGSDDLFTALRQATKPRFDLDYRTEGTCRERPASGGGNAAGASKAAGAPAAAPNAGGANAGVTVVAQAAVGPYDTTVLTADDPQALRRWLDENEYMVPAKLDATTADYVTSKYYFVALKLQQDRESGDLQPLVITWAGDKPTLPIRLTSLSAVPDMDVFVWFLGKHRAVPENYDHVEINEARIDWLNGGSNYRQVVTEAMNEAEGRAFVTDYAGSSAPLALPTGLLARAKLDPAALAGQTDPASFSAAVRSAGYFPDEARLEAFLARHAAGPTVDTAKAAAELAETVVAPAKAITTAVAGSPYLTQLYTTMSPEEMEQDPQFVFNPDMPEVKSLHAAEAITVCSPDYFREDAPIKIKLANGVTYFAAKGTETTGGKPSTGGRNAVQVPAAMHRMRCGTVGKPRTIKDNQSAVVKLLNDLSKQSIALRISTAFGANARAGAGATIVLSVPFAAELAQAAQAAQAATSGFGCAGCSANNAAPVKTGAGEGGAYALVFAGFLGYRRWLGRKP